MQLQVLFKDTDFLAVDKPAGMSVHNIDDADNLLLTLERELRMPKVFPVHRLDKETSGVQLLALNESAARKWAEMFQDRSVEKIYLGVLRGGLKEREGVWTAALSDKSEGRKSPAGLARDRVPCETRYQLLKQNKFFTLCEFQLITGRQHQIRKHASLAKHALVGDDRYGDPKYNAKMASIYKTDRMFLHCHRIEIDGQKLVAAQPPAFDKLLT